MSNIKLTNGILISQSSIDGIKAADTNNILASNIETSVLYTAVEDCFAVAYAASIELNGILLGVSQASPVLMHYTLLKKGDTIKSTSGYGNCIDYVFGLKS